MQEWMNESFDHFVHMQAKLDHHLVSNMSQISKILFLQIRSILICDEVPFLLLLYMLELQFLTYM